MNMRDCNPKILDSFIPLGEISFVGERHIEYRMNTFPGMSGGGIALVSDDEDLHLKLICIHAGFSESLDTNFGFKVTM